MSILDNVLVLGKDVVASSATVFNVIDTGFDGRNLSGNRHGAGYLNVHVNSDVNSTTVQLYEGDTNVPATAVAGTSIVLTEAKAGDQFSVKLPKKLKRYITVKCSIVDTGKIDVFIGAPLADH